MSLVGSPDIILVWPSGREAPPDPVSVPGYAVQPLSHHQDSWWIDIHRKAVPSFSESNLIDWLDRYRELALPSGILVATDDATGEAVATAGSIAHSKDGMFPGGGQLAWVATVPEHRERGLASWLGALATTRLTQEGFERIIVCTGDDMLAAIHVYLGLGYVPCLYASDQRERWARICEAIGHPFKPTDWPSCD